MTANHQEDTSNKDTEQAGLEPAVELLRDKINRIYTDEPDAKEELLESKAEQKHRSKHQEFMYKLSTSGKSLAEIQTSWHNYYVNLPDEEKRDVWQEFYSEHSRINNGPSKEPQEKPKVIPPEHNIAKATPKKDPRTVADVKSQLLGNVRKRNTKLSKKAHFHSLIFGLGIGSIAIVILLFGFFNERFIAPFITPSKSVSNTPIIIDASTTAVGPEPKIIIPKINVEIPVVYDEPSVAEKDIQKALERGVVHYATTASPGETGSSVIFGHSSNNILNKGQYKFAFVLLNRLAVGDTFILHKDGKRYVYKVNERKVVKPNDVSVLTANTDNSTVTLITCDPPGTSINRLLVVGEQISPDPVTNVASSAKQQDDQSLQTIPGNAPSLWDRLTGWITS